MGRQPWLVYGQLKTADGVSRQLGGEVLASLIVFTVLYGVLAVIEAGLMLKYIKAGLTDEPLPRTAGGGDRRRRSRRRPRRPAGGADAHADAPGLLSAEGTRHAPV